MKNYSLLFVLLTLSAPALATTTETPDSPAGSCAGRLVPSEVSRLQAIYAGNAPAANLRERQQNLNELTADLAAGAKAFKGRTVGKGNDYFYGQNLNGEVGAKQMAETLRLFTANLPREKDERSWSGAWNYLAQDKVCIGASVVQIFFKKETPHELRIRLALMLISEAYETDLGRDLLAWATVRSQKQEWIARELATAIQTSKHRRSEESKKYHEDYSSQRPYDRVFHESMNASATATLLSELAPSFTEPKAFESVYEMAVDQASAAEFSSFRGERYLSLRFSVKPNARKAELLQLGVEHFGSISAVLERMGGSEESRILALVDWDLVLSDSIKARFSNPEFELLIYGVFGGPSRGLLRKALAELQEKLASAVKQHDLFNHDEVLALAEKYPEFEKWAEEQLKIP